MRRNFLTVPTSLRLVTQLLLLCVLITGSATPAQADMALTVDQTEVDFDFVGIGDTKSTTVKCLAAGYDQNHSKCVVVTEVALKSGATSPFTVIGFTGEKNIHRDESALALEVSFKPQSVGVFRDELLISWNPCDITLPKQFVQTVKLRGIGDCDSIWKDCAPSRLFCSVDLGKPAFGCTIANSSELVRPSVSQHFQTHMGTSIGFDYSMPFDYLLKLFAPFGLQVPRSLPAGIPKECLAPACADNSPAPILFRRISRSKAEFEWSRPIGDAWKSPTGRMTGCQRKGKTIEADVEVAMPQTLAGRCLVASGVVEYHFRATNRPVVNIAGAGGQVSNFTVSCVSVSTTSSSMLGVGEGGDLVQFFISGSP